MSEALFDVLSWHYDSASYIAFLSSFHTFVETTCRADKVRLSSGLRAEHGEVKWALRFIQQLSLEGVHGFCLDIRKVHFIVSNSATTRTKSTIDERTLVVNIITLWVVVKHVLA